MTAGETSAGEPVGPRPPQGEASAARPRRRKRRDATWKLVLAFCTPLVIAIGVVVVIARQPGSGAAGSSTGPRPNVLVVMTDDQTLESMRVMTNVKRWLGDQGTTFNRFYASFPVCCPSRATFLTGQYGHNNGVMDNVPPAGGFQKLNSDETLAVWLKRSGYYTASVGKYLNGWGANGNIQPPPGWDHWFGLIDPTTYNYYGYSVSNNGRRQDYGTAESDYQTDVLGAEVQRTITEAGRRGQPWFVQFTPLAPHAQEGEHNEGGLFNDSRFAVPAPRHAGSFADEPLPRPPSFNQAEVSGLPPPLRLPPLQPNAEEAIARSYRAELESLLAVDEWMDRLMTTLEQTGQLDRTVVVFTSDNGLFHGEHRLPFGKLLPYEPTAHVPLLIRGGGFPAGAAVDAVTANVDLAPTILALAGARAGVPQDGRDLAPVARSPRDAAGRVILLESRWNRGQRSAVEFAGAVDERYVLLRTDDHVALYDLQTDPHQIDNRAGDPALAEVQRQLTQRLEVLRTCAGETCQQRR